MSNKEIAAKAKENGLTPRTAFRRIKNGEPVETAVSRPRKQGRVANYETPKFVKGETLKRYPFCDKMLTLREISNTYNINYNTLWWQVAKRGIPAETVVNRLQKITTAVGVLAAIEMLPESEKLKFYELLKNGK